MTTAKGIANVAKKMNVKANPVHRVKACVCLAFDVANKDTTQAPMTVARGIANVAKKMNVKANPVHRVKVCA